MKTSNPKTIGLVMLVVGLGIICFWGYSLFKLTTYPFTGNTTEAKIIGYKVSANGVRMIKNDSSSNKLFAARSPFFEFTTNNKNVKTYSKSPQLITFFNYIIGDNVTVAFPKDQPEKAVIVSWKEIPGLLLMISIGLLCVVVGKSYLFNK